MSRFDDQLRRAAYQVGREPLSPDLLDEALDEPPPRPLRTALAAVASAVILVVGVGTGIGQLTVAPPASVGPTASGEASPDAETDVSVTATVEELGIRLTVALDRDSTVFGERVWADATVENTGPGVVFWEHLGGCPWPVVVTVTPDRPTALEQGSDDWPGDQRILKHALTAEPDFPDRHRTFLAEERVDSGAGGCYTIAVTEELPDGEVVRHRAAWDTGDHLGMPPVPGRYTVEVTFSFTRGARPETHGDREMVSVTLPLAVEGEGIDWLSAEEAIDGLLSDERFVDLLADLPRERWTSQYVAFEDGRWVVTLHVGTSAADPEPDATLIGVVDARTGAVLDVRLEVRMVAPAGDTDASGRAS
jgi:hypothetical protein